MYSTTCEPKFLSVDMTLKRIQVSHNLDQINHIFSSNRTLPGIIVTLHEKKQKRGTHPN